ncbi:TPA: ash family protein [Yersinia enterocolitica]
MGHYQTQPTRGGSRLMIFYFFLAGALQYNLGAAAKSVAGIGVPNPLTVSKYIHRMYLDNVRAHLLSMVVRARLSKGRPGSVRAGTPTLFGLPPNGLGVSGGSLINTLTEAAQ